MPKKKDKKYLKWKKGEMEFIQSDFISFFLDDPEVFDFNLDRMEDSVTHPENQRFWEKRAEGYLRRPKSEVTPFVILMWFIEESARKILRKYGHTTDLQELYDYKQLQTYPVTDEHGFTSMVCDLEPESIAAIRVLRLASHLRDYLEVDNADKAALTTMRIMFAAFNMEAGETLMRGIKALAAQHRGATAPKQDKRGFYAAIREVVRLKGINYSRESIWRYLKRFHPGAINSMDKDNYEIWVADENTICQRKDNDPKTERPVTKSTFFKYITEIRPVKNK